MKLNAVGFDIASCVILEKQSGARDQGLIIAYNATNIYCTLEKQN